MVLAQARLLPALLRLRSGLGPWVFTSGWAAVATATLHGMVESRPPGHLAWAWLVPAAITALIAGVAVRTLIVPAARDRSATCSRSPTPTRPWIGARPRDGDAGCGALDVRARVRPSVAGFTELQPIGRGGYATVYRARQVSLGREVALKVGARVLGDERDRRRFAREASTIGRLSGHAHVVAVHDAGITPHGQPYLVMELCRDGSLAERVKREGPLDPELVRRIGVGIADALATAHAAGVLHRDVKPANILLDAYGTPKLADFGLAAAVDAAGESSVTRDALTPAFAPPEAFAMAPPSPGGDVYALGATLYALLAGWPPRAASRRYRSLDELLEALRAPVAPIPGVSPQLHAVLVEALRPEPQDRLPSAAALRDSLQAAGAVDGATAPSASPPERAGAVSRTDSHLAGADDDAPGRDLSRGTRPDPAAAGRSDVRCRRSRTLAGQTIRPGSRT